MKTPLLFLQIAAVGTALAGGVVLDRFLLTPEHQPAAAATSETAAGGVYAPVTIPQTSSATSASGTLLAANSPATAGATRKSLDAILSSKDPRERNHDLQSFINGLKPGEFGEALKRIRQITSTSERDLASRLLIAKWGQTDPDGALQFAAANRGYEYLADDVFQQRASVDFQSALTKAQEIPSNGLRYQALRGVLRAKADSDPAGAIQLAKTIGEFRGNEPLANVLYRQWAGTDPQAAAAFAAQDAQGNGWRSPISQVVNTWAERDPSAAATWSLSLPDGDAQARSLAQVMRDWSRDDPTSASNWIQALPTGARRDTAISGFAQSLVAADPQTAVGWIGTMSDGAARQRALQRVSGEVVRRDPQNGPALLQSAGLPAEQIQQQGRGRARGMRPAPGG